MQGQCRTAIESKKTTNNVMVVSSQQQQQQPHQDGLPPKYMFAARYHEFGGPIRVELCPTPSCPDDGVVIRVHAVGVCRSDWHGWKGHDNDIHNHGLPFIPGHEVSGIVVMSNVIPTFRIGDRVAVPFILSCGNCEYCHCRTDGRNRSTICCDQKQPGFTQYGGFAEYLALPRAQRNLAHIPTNVTFQQAAALGCRFTTAYRAVIQQGKMQSTDTIAIFGCGGLGLSCLLLAVAQGCTNIIAVDISDTALQKARELGATHIVNASSIQNAESLRKHVKELTMNQQGAHVTVEASGFGPSCENAIWCTRPGGRMIQVGLVKGAVSVPMDIITAREIEVIGSHGFASTDLPDLLQMVADGTLDPSILVEQEVSLQEGAEAIEQMDHGSPLGMVMVTKFPMAAREATYSSKL